MNPVRSSAIVSGLLVFAAMASPALALVNGSASTAVPGVGMYWNKGANLICTAFVISPRWLVTAQFCSNGASLANPDTFTTGADPFSPSAPTFHIDAYAYDPAFSSGISQNAHNVVLLHVTADLPYLPLKLSSVAMSSADVGRTVTIMGYGITAQDNTDIAKRIGTTTIASVPGVTLTGNYSPSGICGGDNGGPMFVYDAGFPVALAIATYPSNLQCNSFDNWTRVDQELTFIAAHVADACITGAACGGIFRNTFEPQ